MRLHKPGPGRYPQRGYYAPENPNLSPLFRGPRRRRLPVHWLLAALLAVVALFALVVLL